MRQNLCAKVTNRPAHRIRCAMCEECRSPLAPRAALCCLCRRNDNAERARRPWTDRLAQAPRRLQTLAATASRARRGVYGTNACRTPVGASTLTPDASSDAGDYVARVCLRRDDLVHRSHSRHQSSQGRALCRQSIATGCAGGVAGLAKVGTSGEDSSRGASLGSRAGLPKAQESCGGIVDDEAAFQPRSTALRESEPSKPFETGSWYGVENSTEIALPQNIPLPQAPRFDRKIKEVLFIYKRIEQSREQKKAGHAIGRLHLLRRDAGRDRQDRARIWNFTPSMLGMTKRT